MAGQERYAGWSPSELAEMLSNGIDTLGMEDVRAMLDAGADVTHRFVSAYNATLLHKAAGAGRFDMVQALLDAGVQMEDKDSYGWTALMWAAWKGRTDTVRLLASAGADTDVRSSSGSTALALAEKGNHYKTAEWLRHYIPDKWIKLDENCVAHIESLPLLDRRIIDIFNFQSRERLVVFRNADTGAEALSAPVNFDDVQTPMLEAAVKAFRDAGGTVDSARVYGNRLRKPVLRRNGGA